MACEVLGGLQYSLSKLADSNLEILSSDNSSENQSIGRVRTDPLRDYSGLFDAVPFTPSQGVCPGSPRFMKSKNMFSPFANSFRSGTDNANPVLGGAMSEGSTGSDLSGGLATSPVGGLSGYSPFMGMPWSNNMNTYLSEAPAAPHLEIPESPMSPGLLFNPSPSPGGLGAPGSPCGLFGAPSPTPFGLTGGAASAAGLRTSTGSLHLPSSFTNTTASANLAAAAATADAAAAAAALNPQLPSFYYQAAAAAAGTAGSAAANSAFLQAALSQTLAVQQQQQQQQQHLQQQILQASLSAAFSQAAANPYLQGYPSAMLSALEPMRSAGGSLSLDGGLQQQASMTAAAAVLLQQQQQQHAAAQLRRNLSTPAAVAAQLQLNSAVAAATSQLGLQHATPLAGSASLSPLSAAQMGRLHAAHSADLSHLDAAALLGGSGMVGMSSVRSKSFKARKNSEPKIGPDGQPRLNARQRRTLRRAKERALKGLLEVSQALLQKAEVQVTVPNISHLTALEELAAAEAEKEAAAGGAPAGDGGSLSPSNSVTGGSANNAPAAGPGGVQTRSQQLAAAAAAVEESVCEIARAAVAAVTAQATGRDTSDAAAAAQAAAVNAANAAASAGAVLPAYMMKDVIVEPTSSDELQGTNDSIHVLSHSAPTSPVGSNAAGTDHSSARSSTSSCTSSSNRCSVSGCAVPAACGKPPKASAPAGPAASGAAATGSASCSPVPAKAAARPGSQLEGIDIAGLIGQLSLKKDEGMVDDKLIRDLQIIQSLIGALKAPTTSAGLEAVAAGCPTSLPSAGARSGAGRPGGLSGGGGKQHMVRRANSYSPSSGLAL